MRILITGASGFIGSHLGNALCREHDVLGTTLRSRDPLPFPNCVLDITSESDVAALLDDYHPQVIVHCAAHSRVLASELDPDGARAINVNATVRLVIWAESNRARFIFLSSDQVFSGDSGNYVESDLPDPINHYGRTKLEAEQIVSEASPDNLIVRSNSVVGPTDGRGQSFSEWILEHLHRGEKIALYHDQFRSPIHIRTMVRILQFACLNPVSGVLHAGGPDRISRADMGFSLAECYGLSTEPLEVTSVNSHEYAHIMTRDTSYDISFLRRVMPHLPQRSLADEFAEDVRRSGVNV